MGWPPYPTALRLYLVAAERWAEIDGFYAAVDILSLPPRRFMNCVYAWCVERVEKRDEWDAMLTAELPGTERARPTERQVDQEGADFMAAMQQHQRLTGKAS